jgi:hypothetical protein
MRGADLWRFRLSLPGFGASENPNRMTIISDEVIPANLRCDNDADIIDNTIYYCYDDKLIERCIDASHFIHDRSVLYDTLALLRKPTMKRAFIVC